MTQTPSKTVASKQATVIPKTASTAKKMAPAKTPAVKSEPKKTPSPKAASSKAASKPAVKKASPRATAAGTPGKVEIVKPKKAKKSASALGAVTPEQRYRMICDAAYFRAEKRGFIGGHPDQDWRAAELEVDQRLCDMQEEQQNH